jgi:hypothetical protein
MRGLHGLYVGADEVYQHDIATMKQYRPDYFRITLHKSLRRAGYESVDGDADSSKGKKNTAGNTEKLDSSLSRTKSKIFELGMCNPWEYFVTLTLNKEIHNRHDLSNYKKKLSTWIKNYNRLNETQIKYLLIPEQHKDGSYHMHGLMMNIPIEHLTEFADTDKLPLKILIKIKQGRKIYNWEAYAKAFGYITVEPILNAESVSKYITKYITKDMMKTRINLNDHLYYCSLGLKRAETIYKGYLTKDLTADYENEHVKIKTARTFEEAISYFVDDNE